MYWAIFAIIFFAGFAMTVREGLWSNAISLMNVLISGLVAFTFYSPLTVWLDEQLDGGFTYALDFVLIWALFTFTMVLCRVLTGMASRTRMRFRHPIDPVGGPVLGLFAAWAMASFVMATIHLVPMPKAAFGGKYVYGSKDEILNKSSLSAPDLGFLRFVERMSEATSFGSEDVDHFNAVGFITASTLHRERLEGVTAPWLRVKR